MNLYYMAYNIYIYTHYFILCNIILYYKYYICIYHENRLGSTLNGLILSAEKPLNGDDATALSTGRSTSDVRGDCGGGRDEIGGRLSHMRTMESWKIFLMVYKVQMFRPSTTG